MTLSSTLRTVKLRVYGHKDSISVASPLAAAVDSTKCNSRNHKRQHNVDMNQIMKFE